MRIALLRFLSNSYKTVELNAFLKENTTSLEEAKNVLRDMAIGPNNVINLISTNYGNLGLQRSDSDRVINLPDIGIGNVYDLDNLIIEGSINSKGLKELEEFELKENIQKTNDSIRRTNRNTLRIAILAAFFSLSSVIIAWLSYRQSTAITPEKLVPELKNLNIQLQNIEKELHKDPSYHPCLDSLPQK